MKILVFGAGVLGSCLCHELFEKRACYIPLSSEEATVDRPKIIEKIDPKTHYDAAFFGYAVRSDKGWNSFRK